jgi:hypothetical protein
MKPSSIFILLWCVINLLGCVSQSKLMNSWVGKTKAELYKNLGKPNTITDDGQGGEILIYSSTENMGQNTGTMYSNGGNGVNYYTTPQKRQYSRIKMFYVNKSGIIYRWKLEEF